MRDPNHCFSEAGPGGFFSFMAPRWRRGEGSRTRELRGPVLRVVYNNKLHMHPWVDWTEDIPVLGRLFTGLYTVLFNVLWGPISITRYRRLRSLIRPDLDWSIFLGEIECEIAPDYRLDPNPWRPPTGKEVRIFGDWVVDLGHAPDTGGPTDGKREIHPIHWITRLERRSDDNTVAIFRVTVLADASGRFPPYGDVAGDQGAAANVVPATIRYSLSRDVWPGVGLSGQQVSARVEHRPELPFHWQVVQDGAVRQIDPDTFEFTCQVRGRVGLDADVCQTTQRGSNTSGFWDGKVIFARAWGTPALPPSGGATVSWVGEIAGFYARVGLLLPDPGADYTGPCRMFNGGTPSQPVAVCRGQCEAGSCRLVIQSSASGGSAWCSCG